MNSWKLVVLLACLGGVVLCVKLYEALQVGRQDYSVRQAAEVPTPPMGTPENIDYLIRLLHTVRTGSVNALNKTDLDVGIHFLESLQEYFHDEVLRLKLPSSGSGNNANGGFLQKEGSWETERSNWQETFYPGARYSGEVCGEKLVRSTDLYPNWPYFTLKKSCAKNSPDMTSKVVTVLLNVVTYSERHLNDVKTLLKGIYAAYPKIETVIAVPTGLDLELGTDHTIGVIEAAPDLSSGDVWNSLLAHARTPYVLVGRDLIHFDPDSLLERLIREIPALDLPVIGGSVKSPSTGYWSNGCQQVALRNYTLVTKLGYRHSAHDCLYCNSVAGPFVAKLSLLRKLKFHSGLTEATLFYDFFLRMFRKEQKMAVCPDVMFLVRNEAMTSPTRKQWLPLAVKQGLNRIVNDGETFTFTCRETRVDERLRKGYGTAPCKLQKLSDHIKFVMRMCRENNILCTTNAGTSVGALKLTGVLPWEKDADIHYYSKNSSAVNSLIPLFSKHGYTLKREKYNFFNADVFHSGGSGWKVDFYPFPEEFLKKYVYPGEKMTRVRFDGDWIETPRNIARHIRDRYGPEIYKHVQHSSELNKHQFTQRTGYKWAGHFTPCPTPGRHDCLDLYPADGNLQFSDPVP